MPASPLPSRMPRCTWLVIVRCTTCCRLPRVLRTVSLRLPCMPLRVSPCCPVPGQLSPHLALLPRMCGVVATLLVICRLLSPVCLPPVRPALLFLPPYVPCARVGVGAVPAVLTPPRAAASGHAWSSCNTSISARRSSSFPASASATVAASGPPPRPQRQDVLPVSVAAAPSTSSDTTSGATPSSVSMVLSASAVSHGLISFPNLDAQVQAYIDTNVYSAVCVCVAREAFDVCVFFADVFLPLFLPRSTSSPTSAMLMIPQRGHGVGHCNTPGMQWKPYV
jgi:hypothetical protein